MFETSTHKNNFVHGLNQGITSRRISHLNQITLFIKYESTENQSYIGINIRLYELLKPILGINIT